MKEKISLVLKILLTAILMVLVFTSTHTFASEKAAIVLKLKPGAVHDYQLDNDELDLKTGLILHHLTQQGFVTKDKYINSFVEFPKDYTIPIIMKAKGYNDEQVNWIQSVIEEASRSCVLSVELSFLHPKAGKKPYFGIQYMSDSIPLDNTKATFGVKLNEIQTQTFSKHDVVINNETYSYVEMDADRQENGMFSVSKVPSDSNEREYRLAGVLYGQGHTFIIDEKFQQDEEKIFYALEESN
jgi:hypothetical protein